MRGNCSITMTFPRHSLEEALGTLHHNLWLPASCSLEPKVASIQHVAAPCQHCFLTRLKAQGVELPAQTTKIGELSEGQKSRLVFGMICMQRPNLLLLDEPTNHLDLESIDALADAIKQYKGGLVLVSHDFRLIDQVRRLRKCLVLSSVLQDISTQSYCVGFWGLGRSLI